MKPKAIVLALVVLALVVGGVFFLNQTPGQQPTHQSTTEIPDEKTIISVIENLPDMVLLKSIASLREDTRDLQFRVVERPRKENSYYVVEIWEDFSGELTLFQRYRYDVSTEELIIDIPVNPNEFDIFIHSVIDKNTGEVVAVFDTNRREDCKSASQLGLNFCAGRAVSLADDILNIIYQHILTDNTISQKRKNVLIEEQRMWVREKEERCAPNLLDSGQYDGSIQPLVAATCERQMTRKRIEMLLNTYRE